MSPADDVVIEDEFIYYNEGVDDVDAMGRSIDDDSDYDQLMLPLPVCSTLSCYIFFSGLL